MKKKIFFPNLDGLRFFCFLMVFSYHIGGTDKEDILNNKVYNFVLSDLFGNGILGVNFFFVLSGFLITYLLLEEKKIQRIDIKNFWIRRILRIWPLFYFCVFFGFVLFPLLKTFFGETPNETANPLSYLVFLNNFDVIKNGLPDSSVLGVLWGVAIEEQFYLVWPVIIFAFPTRKLWMVFLAIIAFSLFFRMENNSYMTNNFHTISCISDMSVGAFGAWLILHTARFENYFKNLKVFPIIILYLTFLVLFLFRDEFISQSYLFSVVERLFISIIILSIILEQCYSNHSFYKMSNFKIVSSLGVITYGLYCLHFIGILITTTLTNILGLNTNIWQVLILETILSLALTIFISKISYKYFEKPFLKLKEKFAVITK